MSDVDKPKRAWGRTLEEFQNVEEDFAIDGLYPAELGLIEKCALGEAYLCEGFDVNSPKRPTHRDAETNFIRFDFLRFLFLGGDEITPVDASGVRLVGAYIGDGARGLNIEGHQVPYDIILHCCHLDGDLNAMGASLQTLNLQGSSVQIFKADRMATKGTVFLRNGFEAKGEVRLLGAVIGGNLDCTGGEFLEEGVALHCDKMTTQHSVFLCNGFEAKGTVRLVGAKIGGDLDCTGGKFLGEGVALYCDKKTTKGTVFLSAGFEAKGTVWLLGAEIGGDLECEGGKFLAKGNCIVCQGLHVRGHAQFFSREDIGTTRIAGALILYGAHFEKTLNFADAIFTSKDQAIIAPDLRVGSKLKFSGGSFAGPISITSAVIGGDVTMKGAAFSRGFKLERSNIGGVMFWRNLKLCRKEVSFELTKMEALSFDKKSWAMPKAINRDGMEYKLFQSLPDQCTPKYWTKEFLGPRRRTPGYDIEREPKQFRPQAYGQLAWVLRRMGHEEEAKAVSIEKRRLDVKEEGKRLGTHSAVFERLTLLWNRITGFTIDYGYRPGKAGLWMAGIVVLGWGLYFGASQKGIMTPTHPLIFKEAYNDGMIPESCQDQWTSPECTKAMPSEYSEFSPLLYSADVLLPIINLRQQDDWAPRVVDRHGKKDPWGYLTRAWEWTQTALGWLLSLLLVSGVTGLIRKD